MSEDRDIILALFNPMSDHASGCLFKNDNRMPCQCGFSVVVGHYRWALRRAHEIAKECYGASYEGRGPSQEDEPGPEIVPVSTHEFITVGKRRWCVCCQLFQWKSSDPGVWQPKKHGSQPCPRTTPYAEAKYGNNGVGSDDAERRGAGQARGDDPGLPLADAIDS